MEIKVSNLHKSYLDGEGRKLHILRGLNFEVESGSTVAILGSSGTGKTQAGAGIRAYSGSSYRRRHITIF